MRKPRLGLVFVLFGMLLVQIAMTDLWKIRGTFLQPLLIVLGLTAGIVGLALSFFKDNSEK